MAQQHPIFIYRKGNGGAYVNPPTEVVKPGDSLRFWNLTECVSDVHFKDANVVSQQDFEIAAGGSYDVTVVEKQRKYREYKVKLTCKDDRPNQYAMGASDPGIIVDP